MTTPDANVYWRTPEEEAPPIGQRILLLTWEGCCCDGIWDEGYQAWCPMPKVPQRLKDQRAAYWKNKLASVR